MNLLRYFFFILQVSYLLTLNISQASSWQTATELEIIEMSAIKNKVIYTECFTRSRSYNLKPTLEKLIETDQDVVKQDFFLDLKNQERAGKIFYNPNSKKMTVIFNSLGFFKERSPFYHSHDSLNCLNSLYSREDLYTSALQARWNGLLTALNTFSDLSYGDTEFTFAGYRSGGTLATLAAYTFACKQEKLNANQVKTFSLSPIIGYDAVSVSQIENKLGRDNILNVIYFTENLTRRAWQSHPGVTLEISLFHQLKDNLFDFVECSLWIPKMRAPRNYALGLCTTFTIGLACAVGFSDPTSLASTVLATTCFAVPAIGGTSFWGILSKSFVDNRILTHVIEMYRMKLISDTETMPLI